jgi:hypothetical protein
MPCPHCGALIVVNRVAFVELRPRKAGSGAGEPWRLKERRLAIADAEGKLAHATDALNAARRTRRTRAPRSSGRRRHENESLTGRKRSKQEQTSRRQS